MPRTLLIPLAGDTAAARAAVREFVDESDPVVFPLSDIANGRRRVLRNGGFQNLAVVGAPPDEEIGYGFISVLALATRPARVVRVDLSSGRVTSKSLGAFALTGIPFSAAQLVASAAALVLQGVALRATRRSERAWPLSSTLERLVYLRPSVGSVSPYGGSVTHAHELIRALSAKGLHVEPFTTDTAIADTAARDPEPPCTWRVVRPPRVLRAIPPSAAAGTDLTLVRHALQSAREADVVYQRHSRFSLAGAVLARLAGKPLFLEYNGSERFKGRYWNATPMQRRLAACEDAALAAAARIFVVSEVDRASLLEQGLEPERVIVSPNGVDAERFDRGGGEIVRLRHSIAADRFVVGFVGTFGPWHGAPVLAHAFVEVASAIPNAHMLLVGDGPELDATRRTIENAGLEQRMTSVARVPPSEIPGYLDACDLLASPHVPLPDGVDFFGSPTKLFEYMASGKAIVASRLGQIGEVLEHGVTAYLVEPGNTGELAAGLRTLAGDPDLRSALGTRARQQALSRHSWKINAQQVVDAYAQLARGNR